MYVYINFVCHVQMSKYMYNRFLPNLQRLNKITKGIKSKNLKTN